ncbi:MAG: C40 family peptidase [Haliscomenobacter sp.]|nr:C40 family peptidase [Haliscomenobacter sp.]
MLRVYLFRDEGIWNHAVSQLKGPVHPGALYSGGQSDAGDLIFFRRSASEPVFHVSLVIENDGKSLWVVHSTTSRGVIQEDLLASSYWKPKIYSARDVISGR